MNDVLEGLFHFDHPALWVANAITALSFWLGGRALSATAPWSWAACWASPPAYSGCCR
jgi:hypothetical protein